MSRCRPSGETGETLVELLLAMAILGTAVVAIVGSLVTAVIVSDVHRKLAESQANVRDFAESIESGIATGSHKYADCATIGSYGGYVAAGGYAATVTQVTYWKDTSFVSTCPSMPDQGVQKVSLKVASTDGRASATLNLVVRRPCTGPVSNPCP